MNLFESVEFDAMSFIWPIIIFIITLSVPPLIVKIFFAKFLTKALYNTLITAALLLGFYIWYIPMNMGFHTFFQ